jgi:hypothetical protein
LIKEGRHPGGFDELLMDLAGVAFEADSANR